MPTDTRHTLARIPLRWMIRQCFLTGTGIQFHTDLLRTVGLDPVALYPFVQPRPPPVTSMSHNDNVDATPKMAGTNVQDGTAHTSVATSSHKLTEARVWSVDLKEKLDVSSLFLRSTGLNSPGGDTIHSL